MSAFVFVLNYFNLIVKLNFKTKTTTNSKRGYG